MPQAQIDTVMAFDDDYLGPAAVLALALVRRSQAPVHLHVIDGGFSPGCGEEFAAILKPFTEVTLHAAPDPLVLDLPEGGYNDYLSSASMCRLQIPHLLPAEVNRALYLDADLMILGDPHELWSADLGDTCVGAIRDAGWPNRRVTLDPDGPPRESYEGAAPPGYFNSGVLLMDLPRWRERGVLERCREMHQAVGNELRAPDQDILNIVLESAWTPLPPAWNTVVRALADPEVHQGPDERWAHFVATQQPGPGRDRWDAFLAGGRGIVHYSGRCKPWHDDFPEGPVKANWQDNARIARDMTGLPLAFFHDGRA